MKVKRRNTDLPVSMIYPHPDNPRREVGDITELAESIKSNGIFQNLTVVWGGKGVEKAFPDIDDPDGYTVIIGHRRLAAAKAAGLDVVPCMVAEMDDREQAATMLLENMQRSDLTIYEQAQGFQMMLDLGETQDGIAAKTGFSKTTIRHRLKLLELDPEELRQAQDRQATLNDYIELEKIKDPADKNEALKAIGTSDFKWKVQRIIAREGAAANLKSNIAVFESKGLKPIPFESRFDYKQVGYYTMSKAIDDKGVQELGELIEKGAIYYTVSKDDPQYAWAYIYTEAAKPTAEETAAEKSREQENEKRRERDAKLRDVEEQARALRERFVKGFANREHIMYLTEKMLTDNRLDDIDYEIVAGLLGLDFSEYDYTTLHEFLESKGYTEIVQRNPEKVMLCILASLYNCSGYAAMLHEFTGYYKRNSNLEKWYAILSHVGYRLSSDERKLLSGTHEYFLKAD